MQFKIFELHECKTVFNPSSKIESLFQSPKDKKAETQTP